MCTAGEVTNNLKVNDHRKISSLEIAVLKSIFDREQIDTKGQ